MNLPPDLMTGNADVDEQHAGIFAELDRLRGASPGEVTGSLEFLSTYATSHFGFEERLMEQVGYPRLDEHRHEHLWFFDEFVVMRARLARGGPTPENVDRLVAGVEGWIRSHVLRQDRRLADFIRARVAMGA